jgi:hypothetical protein
MLVKTERHRNTICRRLDGRDGLLERDAGRTVSRTAGACARARKRARWGTTSRVSSMLLCVASRIKWSSAEKAVFMNNYY